MKRPKLLLALIGILLAYGVLLTVRCVDLERRLRRLEASHQELERSYRVDRNILAHVQVTPEFVEIARAAGAKELDRMPRTNSVLRPPVTEVNPPPAGASSR
jgi:hypothetical protein